MKVLPWGPGKLSHGVNLPPAQGKEGREEAPWLFYQLSRCGARGDKRGVRLTKYQQTSKSGDRLPMRVFSGVLLFL